MFPNTCCENSMNSYEANDDLGLFEVIGGRDVVDEELLVKCKDCHDEWSRRYQKGGTLIWMKTKQVSQPS